MNKKNKLRTDLKKHEYLINKNIQDSNQRAFIDFSKIYRKDVSKFPVSINDFYNIKMGVSGYGETRHFYADKEIHKHTGVDVFLNEGEKILAPSGTEILSAYWLGQEEEWAEGVGGVICLRMKISTLHVPNELKEYVYIKKKIFQEKKESWIYFRTPKLSFSKNGQYKKLNFPEIEFTTKNDYEKYLDSIKIDQRNKIQEESKYIYARIIHLSKNTINLLSNNVKTISCTLLSEKEKYTAIVAMDIDANNPKKFKKGDVLGFIGGPNENGGWATHADINLYAVFSPLIQGQKYKGQWNKYVLNNSFSGTKILLQIMKCVKVRGISKIEAKYEPTRKENIIKLKSEGNFDPNEIFNFYQNDDTKIIAS